MTLQSRMRPVQVALAGALFCAEAQLARATEAATRARLTDEIAQQKDYL